MPTGFRLNNARKKYSMKEIMMFLTMDKIFWPPEMLPPAPRKTPQDSELPGWVRHLKAKVFAKEMKIKVEQLHKKREMKWRQEELLHKQRQKLLHEAKQSSEKPSQAPHVRG